MAHRQTEHYIILYYIILYYIILYYIALNPFFLFTSYCNLQGTSSIQPDRPPVCVCAWKEALF